MCPTVLQDLSIILKDTSWTKEMSDNKTDKGKQKRWKRRRRRWGSEKSWKNTNKTNKSSEHTNRTIQLQSFFFPSFFISLNFFFCFLFLHIALFFFFFRLKSYVIKYHFWLLHHHHHLLLLLLLLLLLVLFILPLCHFCIFSFNNSQNLPPSFSPLIQKKKEKKKDNKNLCIHSKFCLHIIQAAKNAKQIAKAKQKNAEAK